MPNEDFYDAQINMAVADCAEAQRHLQNLLVEACPGTHDPKQYRDGRPPWCKACRRTNQGVRVPALPTVKGRHLRSVGDPAPDLLATVGDNSVAAFQQSRARCATCGHRRKDHEEEPNSSCSRYDDPDCGCVQFIEKGEPWPSA